MVHQISQYLLVHLPILTVSYSKGKPLNWDLGEYVWVVHYKLNMVMETPSCICTHNLKFVFTSYGFGSIWHVPFLQPTTHIHLKLHCSIITSSLFIKNNFQSLQISEKQIACSFSKSHAPISILISIKALSQWKRWLTLILVYLILTLPT
jgi:hypothetical protein